MKFWSCIFHVLLQILVCRIINSVLATSFAHESDRLTLLAIKNQIHDDPFGALASWSNQSIHHCDWYGITCSHRHRNRVISLILHHQKLGGTLSPHIGNLSFLRNITLHMNNFHGPIPQEVGHLSRLKYLWLSNNSFSGPIPTNLTYCSNLLTIMLVDNDLTREIPVELTSLPKLQILGLGRNKLTGSIPSSLGNLSSLIAFSLLDSFFEGSIPEDLCHLQRLEFFYFRSNNFNGTVPSCLYNLTNIQTFGLEDNQLHGNLPLDMGLTLPNLQYLGMGTNKFNGPIPSSLINASNLQRIDLSQNQFTGQILTNMGRLHGLRNLFLHSNQLGSTSEDDLKFISTLTNCSLLERFQVGYNSLRGLIPNSIANLSTQLTHLDFTENLIYGSIPDGIKNLVKLNIIDFSNNHLSNKVPPSITMIPSLQILDLGGNHFSGEIPDSLCNSTLLLRLFLSKNNFHGKIPLSLANCTRLSSLYLDGNRLTGSISIQVLNGFSSMIFLDLSNNELSGPLPTEIGRLTKLVGLKVSSNRLFGRLPDQLGNCIMLVRLYINDNHFEGKLPKSLSRLKASLEELDLSRNKFSSLIPEYLVNFTFLYYLNLSYNEFDGQVPKNGVFANVSAISIEGNNKLCGGIDKLKLMPCYNLDFKKKGTSLNVKIVILVVVLSITLLLISFFILTFYRRGVSLQKLSPALLFTHQRAKISYAELLKATNNFSANNLIGSGSYGTVYKGTLIHDNRNVAVKVLNLQEQGASKSFLFECNALRNIRHRNLLKIITCCSSVDFQGNEFKALVFDFMAKGSLEEWLHPKGGGHHELRNLNFLQRLNIAIDIASALDYLHNHCQPVVVHCDIKPSNILLDDNMVAHVSDFGLAKIFLAELDVSSNIQSTSLALKGTVGYVAPEYGTGREVSVKGDVYSYGILLLEMFTGKRPTDQMFQDAQDLHYFVEAALPDRVMDIIDPTMPLEPIGVAVHKQDQSDRQSQMCDYLALTLRLGVTCSTKLPIDRIDIGEVILELYRIKDHYHASVIHFEGKDNMLYFEHALSRS